MLKKMIAALSGVLVLTAMQAAPLAVWDFSSPEKMNKTDAVKMRGNTRIVDGKLLIAPSGNIAKAAGAVAVKPELQAMPQGSFDLSVTFTIDSAAAAKVKNSFMLFDCKYVAMPNAKQAKYHKGFMLSLERRPSNMYQLNTALGYGNKSAMARSKAVKITPDTEHTVKLRFLRSGKVSFYLDGKLVDTRNVPAGKLADPVLFWAIGDRAASSYMPLAGSISQVVLEDVKDEAPAPVPAPAAQAAPAAAPANGDIVASWDFSKPDVLNGTVPMKYRGQTKIVNGALQIDPTGDLSKPSGIISVKPYPPVTPQNAFDIVADFTLDAALTARARHNLMLVDFKYVTMPNPQQGRYHNGFQLFLTKSNKPDTYIINAAFGFGKTSSLARSQAVKLPSGERQSIRVNFSAAGKVNFFCNGSAAGDSAVAIGSVTAPKLFFVIGDRAGSNYSPFTGMIHKIELRKAAFQPVSISADPAKRTAFERGESAIALNVRVSNNGQTALNDLTLKVKPDFFGSTPTAITSLNPQEIKNLTIRVSPWLLPGKYDAEAELRSSDGKVLAVTKLPLFIAPQRRDFMPVVLWGAENPAEVKSLGFTHQMISLIPIRGMFGASQIPGAVKQLDKSLADGLYAYSAVITKYRFIQPKRYLRKTKDGKYPSRANVEASHPAVRKEFAELMKSTALAIGDHPAWDMVLSNSEVRDSSHLSFAHKEPENFEKYAGFPVPEHTRARNYKIISDFPWDQVLSSKHKELIFYSWFYRVGDGWNPLHELICQTLHQYIKRPGFTVFYDPVTRVPPQWGSGGNIDAVSQWTYTNPDPIKIGQTTDEVIAMADGFPGQKVYSMTQAIWYRAQCAPAGRKVADPPEWLSREAKARFVTIPPDALKIALWTKLSRRLDGIMYHGSGSLIATQNHSYRYTNPHSKGELKKIAESVIKPLGPVLTKVPERLPEVAILESFASNLYAPQHFPRGWGGKWVADLHLALQWNHIQAGILYEEHLLKNLKTQNLKVLFLPGAEVLTDEVLSKLQALQRSGVILIGDEFTNPALMVDARIASVKRDTLDPAGSKKAFQKLGREIAELLKKYYISPMQASNQDMVLYRRGTADADYVFVINDKRTFGDYVGQWKLVMEKGLANSGTVTVAYPGDFVEQAAAYDLVAHREVPLKKAGKKITFANKLDPASGRLVMVLKRPINSIELAAPRKLNRLDKYQLKVQLLDAERKYIKAILPVEMTLTASNGRKLPGSGYYAAVDGSLVIDEVIASNTPKGEIKVTAKCLSSGKTAAATINIQ